MANIEKSFIRDVCNSWVQFTETAYIVNIPEFLEGNSSGHTEGIGKYAILSGYRYMDYSIPTCVYQLATDPNYGIYILPNNFDAGKTGFNVVSGREWSASQAQTWVDKLISNQKHILQNNLVCARFSNKFSAKEKKQLYNLQLRLVNRDEKLRDSNFVSGLEQSSPYGYSELSSYLQSFMSSGGVGVVISTSTIIITALVLSLASTAAYYMYKYYYNQSEEDIKYSDELMAVLKSKLTDEEFQQLYKETKGIVTKAKFKSSFGAYGSIVKWGLIALGGLVAYKFVRDNYKKHKNDL